MAHGEPFNVNIPAADIDIELNNANALLFIEIWPEYVLQVTMTEDDVERTLPEIHIPRHLIAFNPGFYTDLVRRSLNELTRYSLTPGPGHNPLLSMLAWNADYWSITVNASGESMQIAFYPVYFYGPSAERVETSTSESSSDDEQPGPSHQVNNRSEIRTGGSSMNRSSTDDEQPGPSHQVNNRSEIRSGGSRTLANQSSVSQEMRQGVKRKRNNSGRSESREQERKKTDHHSDSDSSSDSLTSTFSPPSLGETSRDDDQPGPSHRVNNRSEIRSGESRTPADQSSGSQVEMRQGVKRKRKTSGRSESREQGRRRSDHHPDSDSSSDSLSSMFFPPASLGETSRDEDQPGPSHRNNSEARAGGSSMIGSSTNDEQPGHSHRVNN
ncbi:hypothetical protein DPX16_11420 [Anabarilius grahami]|uniref:Uncharacterized protein n=1 Tax=Anabarilius grahami TaxID=495550 RepID=A0A3N0Y519_ANAGA|nr:hypothetical protein DPX16_11420 [Anabarilius grahami]